MYDPLLTEWIMKDRMRQIQREFEAYRLVELASAGREPWLSRRLGELRCWALDLLARLDPSLEPCEAQPSA
jgi:hypothetical protein